MPVFTWLSGLVGLVVLCQATYSEEKTWGERVSSPGPRYTNKNQYANDGLLRSNSALEDQSIRLIRVLEGFKSGYDAKARPHFDENIPEEVTVRLYVTQLGPFSDMTMDFDCDMFLILKWTDARLKWSAGDIWHSHYPNHLQIPDSMFDDFWKPDVFFRNSKSAEKHKVSQPNRVLMVEENGTVTYKERISVKSHCYFDLRNYPFDSQTCKFEIESFKFTEDVIRLYWDPVNAMSFPIEPADEPDAFKNEWILVGPPNPMNKNRTAEEGQYSRLTGDFKIIRNVKYSAVQTYTPSMFIVCMSVVGFWIDNEDAMQRMSLAVTTILTMTAMTEGVKSSLPKLSYVHQIDVWLLFCTIFIYMALFQSAFVYYILRCGKKEIPEPEKKATNRMGRNTNIVEPEHIVDNTPSKPQMYYIHLKRNTPEMAQAYARKINLLSKISFPVIFVAFNIVYWTINLRNYFNCQTYYICGNSFF